MKKLLTMLAVSTLVGTSASNLKPVFTNNVVNHGFKSNQLNKNLTMINSPFINDFQDLKNKKIQKVIIAPNGTIYAGSSTTGLWKSTDGVNFKQVNGIPNSYAIQSIDIALSGEIWVGTNQELYFSNDNGINFNSVTNNKINNITSIAIAPNGTVYVGVYGNGLWKLTKGETDFEKLTSVSSSMIYSINIDKNGNIFFGSSLSFKNTGLWKSTDGINFTNIYPKNNIDSIAIAPNGTIYAKINTKLNKSTDGGITFEQVNGISDEYYVNSIATAPNGTVWVGTEKEGQHGSGLLYKSTDGVNFKSLSGIVETIKCVYLSDDNIYFTTGDYYTDGGLFKGHLINDLLKINKPDYWDSLFDGFVYKNEQKLDFKEQYLKSAILDGNSITVPSTDVDIASGEHTLILTLKDEYRQYLDLFSGDITTGQVTYKLWVKTSIDKNKINYKTNVDDTDLLTGLVSDLGNTIGKPIIQTRSKQGSSHSATLNSKFDDILIDYPNSFYVQGTVNETTNDFTEVKTHQTFSKNLNINNDGIYHLHLVDVVGNIYESYLELGESNWKLQGKFDDQDLNDKSNKLNVTVDSHSASQEVKQEANGWLDNYKNIADNTFNNIVSTKGKGFVISIDSDLKGDYKSFLDPVTYVNTQTLYAINQSKLDKVISDIAEQKLQDGLEKLPKNLNVDIKNVVNKSTLDNYSVWIKNYQDFINKKEDKWINEIEKIASRGFATTEQEQQIKDQVIQFLNNDNIKKYLKNIVWEDNKLLKATSNDYQQYIELDKLQSDTIDWVNTNMKDINIAYQQAIKNAESGLNLHGYSIDEILNGKQKPQTKNEIDNFAAGQSYHDWLQSQANIKFRDWGLLLGFSIGIPLILLSFVAGIFIRWRTNPKYRGYWRARQLDKQDKVAEMKKIKNIRKENKGIKKNHDE
ncbi:hypothetical protein [Spiroplasma endosymbiont of Amphimallon solstitiale]|uniref:hypothetical protein n=1 Tax=Spiroplasma endosymbiont of Amphimallon solstitiale TaxID=3066288 RepID=UPI00313AC78B